MTRPADYPQGLIWDRFYEMTQVPRPSKKEEKIRNYLVDFAKQRNLKYALDDIGNVVIYLPATAGYEEHEAVIIQNHMDMVTDSTADRVIDFDNDPLVLLIENGWVTADRTTLGADNGIGCAASLAIVDESNLVHPPLELLFTVDEETGLNGAINLDAKLLSGKKMINLDTEEWGAIYIGCAGGMDYELNGSLAYEKSKAGDTTYQIALDGLKGGHSGMDIHLGRGNALVLLINLLNQISFPYSFSSLVGGKAHNIIPRDAMLSLSFDSKYLTTLEELVITVKNEMLSFLPQEDQNLNITVTTLDGECNVVTSDSFPQVIGFLTLFPHGAYSYNWDVEPPCANVSSNFAILELTHEKLYMQTSCRFFEKNELRPISQKIELLAKMLNLDLKIGCGYPSWKPAIKNDLLDLAKLEFEKSFGFLPESKAIHAGLECGLLKEKVGEMDIISFGPNITGAHSPSERIEIESTDKFYEFVKTILSKL